MIQTLAAGEAMFHLQMDKAARVDKKMIEDTPKLCWCKLLQVIKNFHTISATFTLQVSPISKRVKFFNTIVSDTRVM